MGLCGRGRRVVGQLGNDGSGCVQGLADAEQVLGAHAEFVGFALGQSGGDALGLGEHARYLWVIRYVFIGIIKSRMKAGAEPAWYTLVGFFISY